MSNEHEYYFGLAMFEKTQDGKTTISPEMYRVFGFFLKSTLT